MDTNHRNNFDFLRFAAAVLVWYGHCYTLAGLPEPLGRFIPFESSAELGVAVFCIISGYFIARSYEIHEHVLVFLRNRALRVLPGLWVAVLLTVFLIGPLVSGLSMPHYFASSATWNYLRGLLVFPWQEHLPGLFRGNNTDVVNGALWVLPHGVRLYGVIALLGVLGILQPRLVGVLLLGMLAVRVYGVAMHLHPKQSVLGREWGDWELMARLASEFAAGSLLYLARDLLPLRPVYLIICIVIAAACVFCPFPAFGHIVFDLAFAYLVICLGFMKLPLLHGFGGWGDFSYGFYLYAFVMQQVFLQVMGADADFLAFQLASFSATFLCAVLSWHCIEKHALALKG